MHNFLKEWFQCVLWVNPAYWVYMAGALGVVLVERSTRVASLSRVQKLPHVR